MSRQRSTWLEALAAGKVLLLDGATGTELRRRGVELDAAAWSGPATLAHADLLTAIHADYLRAGADVLTTNTFATSRFVLEAAGCADRFIEINRTAVEAALRARDAVGREATIAGSISCLPPGFDPAAYPSPDEEAAAYRELAALLAELGVDLLTLEMMEDVEHASRACEAASATGLPFWLGVSCRLDGHGRLAAYDFPATLVDDVLDALLGFGPAVVNVMHTPPAAVPAALELLGRRWSGFRGAYPELDHEGSPRAPAAAAPPAPRLTDLAAAWIAAGARIVGGCCGTTPADIRPLRDLLDCLEAC